MDKSFAIAGAFLSAVGVLGFTLLSPTIRRRLRISPEFAPLRILSILFIVLGILFVAASLLGLHF